MNEEKASPKTLTSLLLLENFISSFLGGEPPQIINKSPEPSGKSEEAIHSSSVFSQRQLKVK